MEIKEKEAEEEGKFACLDDFLRYQDLKDGIIHITGELSNFRARDLALFWGEIKRRFKAGDTLTVYLDSEGGEVHGAFAIYDALRRISKEGVKIRIIVEGLAASAAAMIVLQAGDERISRPHATFLLHEPKRWVFFNSESTSQLENEVTEMNRITDLIVKILADRCGKTEEEVRETIRLREVWMSPEDAKEWGLIDKIEE